MSRKLRNEIYVEGFACEQYKSKEIGNNNLVVNGKIVYNRFYKKGESFEKETSYFNIEAWNEAGRDFIEKAKKGNIVGITGRLKEEYWMDGEKQRSKAKIIAQKIDLVEERQGRESEERQEPEIETGPEDMERPAEREENSYQGDIF